MSNIKLVKKKYENKKEVQTYIDNRFRKTIYLTLHKKQVKILNTFFDKNKTNNVFEIALGPARLTSDINHSKGTAIDNSKEMIKIAKKRLAEKKKSWRIIQGNAFNLPKKNKFDTIFTFRFIRHFNNSERNKLYSEIRKVSNKNSYLIFDVLNKNKAKIIQKIIGKNRNEVYDELYTPETITQEMNSNGFKVVALIPVLNHFFCQWIISTILDFLNLRTLSLKLILFLETIPSKQPLEWVIICQKK